MNQITIHQEAPMQEMGIILKDGSLFYVDDEFMQILAHTHKGKDIQQALNEMASWCYANPSKRKTSRGIKRFINSWLSRQRAPIVDSTRNRTLQEDYNDTSWAI